MPGDLVLTRDGPVGVPLNYQVPQGGELLPLTVRADIDGTSASGPFYAVLEVRSPSGKSMGKYRSDAIAAGGSADVTWFPGAELEEEAAGAGAGVIVESFYLDSKASSPVSSSTVLQSGRPYVITVQGTYSEWNAALLVGTPNADAMFPSSLAGRVSTQVGIDAECCFAADTTGGAFTVGQHTTCFGMNLGSGMQHVEPVGGPYNTPAPNYFYTYNVTGQGSVASFLTTFTPQSDNYGKLLITIQTVGGSSSGGGGGSLLPDPSLQPDGAWLRTTSGTAVWRATPQVTETDMSLSDVTTLNVSTSKHGFAPKSPNDATKYLDGTGAYSVPAGTGSPLTTKGDLFGHSTVDARIPIGSNNQVLTADSAQTLGLKWAALPADVSSLDSITGAVTLVAGSGITIADNSPGAGQISISGSGTASGAEISYTQITSAVNVTSTTESSGTTIISPSAFTPNGSAIVAHFFGTATSPNGTSVSVVVCLFEGSTQITRLGTVFVASSSGNNQILIPFNGFYRFTPSNASHTYTVTAFCSTTTGTPAVGGGAGGTGGNPPCFIRFSYA